jgi:MFS family permease
MTSPGVPARAGSPDRPDAPSPPSRLSTAADFRRLLAGRTVSTIGDGVAQVAIAFAVLQLTNSATAIGIVLAARLIPLIALMLVSGAWADRYSRRMLMVVSDGICCATQALLAGLLVTGHATLAVVAILYAIYGAGTALFRPASTGLVPRLVPRELLQKANASLGLSMSLGTIAGPILGGLVVAAARPAWGIALDAFSFLVSGLLLAAIRSGSTGRATGGHLGRELAAGWREFRRRRWLVVSVVYFALYQMVAIGPLYVLGPLVASNHYSGAVSWGALLTAAGVGSLAGGTLAYKRPVRRPLRSTYHALLLTPAVLVALAAVAPFPLLAGAMFTFGGALAYGTALWSTSMQQNIPDEMLSRLTAYDWLGSTALRPLGFAIAGPAAGAVGADVVLSAASGLVLVATLWARASGSIRRLDVQSGRALESSVRRPRGGS